MPPLRVVKIKNGTSHSVVVELFPEGIESLLGAKEHRFQIFSRLLLFQILKHHIHPAFVQRTGFQETASFLIMKSTIPLVAAIFTRQK